jgi:hypothetical protein
MAHTARSGVKSSKPWVVPATTNSRTPGPDGSLAPSTLKTRAVHYNVGLVLVVRLLVVGPVGREDSCVQTTMPEHLGVALIRRERGQGRLCTKWHDGSWATTKRPGTSGHDKTPATM